MRAALTIVNVLLLGSGLIGCFDFLSNAQDFQQGEGGASGTGDAGGIGGTGGTSTATSPPPECVPSGTSKAVDESCGIFVSPGGSDATGDGTQKNPYSTITKALSQGQVVYACADAAKPYGETITVEKQGIYIFGGLDCSTWIYNATNRTPLMASPGEIPLRIVGDAALQIEDFAITAADAPELMPGQHAAGASSIAVIAEATSTLTMARCDVSAGRGAMGGHGEPPMGSAASGPDGEDGLGGCDADGELPGNGGQQMCGSTDVSGGLGGQGTKLSSGGKGSGGQPMGPLGLGGQPQPVAVTCDQGGNGGNGAEGLAGEHGKGAAADALGSLSAAGFLGTRGPDGMPGQPAQGGGGGGGARVCLNGKAGPSGGGGGAGGCGGAGGKGGYPGGASIGIVSLGATLLFNNVTIKAGDGGNGGSGQGGQEGGAGGTGGVPGPGDSNAIACGGGKGGAGGEGGAGGGGLGGHSIGIAHAGAAPSTDGTTIILGIPGDGGKGFGLLPEHNGASGVAQPVQAF